jgi:hypothetical protein
MTGTGEVYLKPAKFWDNTLDWQLKFKLKSTYNKNIQSGLTLPASYSTSSELGVQGIRFLNYTETDTYGSILMNKSINLQTSSSLLYSSANTWYTITVTKQGNNITVTNGTITLSGTVANMGVTYPYGLLTFLKWHESATINIKELTVTQL